MCKPGAYALYCHDEKDDLQSNATLSACVVIRLVIFVHDEKKKNIFFSSLTANNI